MKQLHEKRYFLVAGDPRRIGQHREATSHQYWPPDELKNMVEGVEQESNKSLGIALFCFAIVIIGAVWWALS
jgi:hypothetical protein